MAMQYLGITVCVLFFVGLIASTYASADSALTALTTSICVDFLDIEKKENSEKTNRKIRTLVHLGISFVLFLLIFFWHLYQICTAEQMGTNYLYSLSTVYMVA